MATAKLLDPQVLLHKHLSGEDEARDPETCHASDVTKEEYEFCPREHALRLINKAPGKKNFIIASQRVTFSIGYDLEDRVVGWFADMGRLKGNWECAACKAKAIWCYRPSECGRCHSAAFKYVQMRFECQETGISCGIDGMLDLGEEIGTTKLIPLEVKSMDKDKWNDLKFPLAEHQVRTRLYLRCIEKSGFPHLKEINTKEGRILYITKGGWGKKGDKKLPDGYFSPFKFYTQLRMDAGLEAYLNRARQLKKFKEGGPLPPRICPNSLQKRAGSCSMVRKCFPK